MSSSAPRWKIFHVPRFSVLLLALFAFLIATPLLPLSVKGLRLIDITITALLIVGILSVERRHLEKYAWTLAIPALACSWAVYLYPSAALMLTGLVFRSAFLLLLLWIVVADILKQRTVTTDTLAAAACGYLLIGVLWAGVYAMMELVQPGSFNLPSEPAREFFDDSSPTTIWFLYYSFVTITTLGYGDVTPATVGAGMVAATEAIVGQLYVAVLIARLVGMHAASRD